VPSHLLPPPNSSWIVSFPISSMVHIFLVSSFFVEVASVFFCFFFFRRRPLSHPGSCVVEQVLTRFSSFFFSFVWLLGSLPSLHRLSSFVIHPSPSFPCATSQRCAPATEGGGLFGLWVGGVVLGGGGLSLPSSSR